MRTRHAVIVLALALGGCAAPAVAPLRLVHEALVDPGSETSAALVERWAGRADRAFDAAPAGFWSRRAYHLWRAGHGADASAALATAREREPAFAALHDALAALLQEAPRR